MPVLEIVNTSKLVLDELRQWWQNQDESYDPLEELLRLERELSQLEQQYGLSSAEFQRRYQAGEMGDDIAFVRWTGRHRLYTNLTRVISDGERET
jgi:hypothetical protein